MSVHKKYQPVIYEKIPKLLYSEDKGSEYYQWWDEQIKRCLFGYKPDSYDWIPGRYYFYLNFCKIKIAEGSREEISHPFLRDLDMEYALAIEDAKPKFKNGELIQQGRGIIMPKRRECGASYMNMGMLITYETVFFEGNEVGVATAIPEYLKKNKAIFDLNYNNLPDALFADRTINNKEEYEFGFKEQEILPDGRKMPQRTTGILSKLHWKPHLNQNQNAINSLRVSALLFDEAGLINNLFNILLKNKACFMRGSHQFGTPIFAGTVKSFEAKDNQFEQMYEAADELRLIKFPVYGYKALHGFINYETGKSDEKGALKYIQENEYKPVINDKSKLSIIQQEYPTEIDHFFLRKSGGLLNLPIIRDQIKNIKEHKGFNARTNQHGLVEQGFLRWKRWKEEVEWIPSPKGDIFIYLHPQKKGNAFSFTKLDVGGVDPYNKTATVESDSKGACYVYRRFVGIDMECELPILEYIDRPTYTMYELGMKFQEKDVFYNNLHKIAIYYGCQLLVEDTDEQLFSKFKEWGAHHKVLARKPVNEISVNSKQQNIFGIAPTPGVLINCTEVLNQNLVSHPESILFLRLLEDMLKWGAANTDMAIAYSYALLCARDLDSRRVLAKENTRVEEKQSSFGAEWVRNPDGTMSCISDKSYIKDVHHLIHRN